MATDRCQRTWARPSTVSTPPVSTPPPPRALDTERLPADRLARRPARAPPDLTGRTAYGGNRDGKPRRPSRDVARGAWTPCDGPEARRAGSAAIGARGPSGQRTGPGVRRRG